ncbi:MAG TPA: hypothetical protein VH598_04765 [Verrucomicrobiae bacterium]|nr:hypothetical protein [Verrucomicrobiae bacterium]
MATEDYIAEPPAGHNWFPFPGVITAFNWLINSNRGYRAPYNEGKGMGARGAAFLVSKGITSLLGVEPGAVIAIKVVPQAADFTHAVAQSRLLPQFSLESTSGGWVPEPYCFDPAPSIPNILLPAAQWSKSAGQINLIGLTTSNATRVPGTIVAFGNNMGAS